MKLEKLKKLAISCGGTGGHFNPGLGIAKEFQAQGGVPFLFLGGKHAPAQKITAEENKIRAVMFDFIRPGLNPMTALRSIGSMIRGYSFAKSTFRAEKPDALLIMGSSVSVPAALAARSLGIPIFLHDGNARIGKANRILSRMARAIALSFPAANAETLHCESVLTGMPLRRALTDGPEWTKAQAVEMLNKTFSAGFDSAKPVLLIFGGSLGAAAINENFDIDPSNPLVKDLQVIHLSGPGKAESLREKYQSFPCKILLLEKSNEMKMIYSASDAVVCRAGGSTAAELAFFGKYAVLVPYPFAAELHQNDNANYLASGGGAEIVENSACTREFFRSFVTRLLADPESFRLKGLASKKLAFPAAAQSVLEMMEGRL